MKKIISFIIACSMMITMFGMIACAEETAISVPTSIEARIRSDIATYTSDPVSVTSTSPEAAFDLKSTLNMANALSAFKVIADTKSEANRQQFILKGEFNISIKYPKTVDGSAVEKYSSSDNYGFVALPDIFVVESYAKDDTNTDYTLINVKVKLKDNVTVDEISKDESKLSNIVFEGKNVKTNAFGTYNVTVSLDSAVVDIYNKSNLENKVAEKTFSSSPATATLIVNQQTGGSGGSSSGGSVSVETKPDVTSDKKPGTYASGSKVHLSSSIKGGKVYYTTDGSEPTFDKNGVPTGNTKIYDGEITLDTDATIKAISVSSDLKKTSDIKTYDYKVEGLDVVIDVKGGIVKKGQKVTLSTTKGTKIYYTTDGSEPTFDENGQPTGTTKLYEDSITVDDDIEINAISVNEDGSVKSLMASEKYTVAYDLVKDHIAYIQGDNFGNFNPEMPITRAEVATIFSRITVKKMNVDYSEPSKFSDVADSDWFATAVAFMEKANIVNGYEDGSFRPNNYITRAEFAAIASRYDRLSEVSALDFSDVNVNHWAFNNINSAVDKGWVKGYEDNTFKPDANIKRSEVVTVVNRMLGRNAEEEFKGESTDGLIMFPDNLESHWAYYEVIESSNTHEIADK